MIFITQAIEISLVTGITEGVRPEEIDDVIELGVDIARFASILAPIDTAEVEQVLIVDCLAHVHRNSAPPHTFTGRSSGFMPLSNMPRWYSICSRFWIM